MDWIEIAKDIGIPCITGVVCWFGGRWKRRTDAMGTMQNTINMLVEKNDQLYTKVTKLQDDNFELLMMVNSLKAENGELKSLVESLRRDFSTEPKKTKK